jgi:hypothetical protein
MGDRWWTRARSVPENEDSLGLEGILSLDEMLNGVLAIVSHLSPEVVHEEGLREVVFIVGERHGLEVEGHHSAGLNIAELIAASRGVGIRVEELGDGSAVLREIGAVSATVPLLIVVNNVVGGRCEQLAKLLILENLIEHPDFVNGGLSTLISDSSQGSHREEGEVQLPDEGLVEH